MQTPLTWNCVSRWGALSSAQTRIVVVGAGLAGLTAALTAAEAGAKVELIAQGQGALTLFPGWIEIGDALTLAEHGSIPTRKRARC